VLLGAENALGNEQMSVLLCDARGDAIRRRHYIRTLLARQVDGFIILGDSNEIRPSLTKEIPVPVVYAYCELRIFIFTPQEVAIRKCSAHISKPNLIQQRSFFLPLTSFGLVKTIAFDAAT